MGAAPRPVVTKPFDAEQLTAHFLFRGVGHEVRILIVRRDYRKQKCGKLWSIHVQSFYVF
jgi:hypothetical protein